MTDSNTVLTTTAGGEGARVSAATNRMLALMDASERLGNWIAVGIGGRVFKNREHGRIVAMKCLTEGLTPDEFFQKYHILGTGMITPTANAMLGKFVSLGGKYEILEQSEQRCRIKWTWGKKVKETEFTIEQAKRKGMVKAGSAWATWPEDQLMWTTVRKYLRREVPEHFGGEWGDDGAREEIIDYTNSNPTLVEAAAPVDAEVLPPPTQPTGATPEAHTEDRGGGGGLDADGLLIDVDVLPASDPDEPPALSEALKAAGISLPSAVGFLQHVAGWLAEADIAGKPVAAVVNGMSDRKQTYIREHLDQFVKKVDAYEKKASGDAGEPAAEPPNSEPKDLKPIDADSITAPAKQRKSRSKKVENDEENGE